MSNKESKEKSHRVCPWWLGYLLVSPLRRLLQNPEKIISPYIKDGMTVLEIGPGMGFFTLTMARSVGEKGKIICVDIQEKMLQTLKKRARRVGLEPKIVIRTATAKSLSIQDFAGQIDFALLFAVVHEIPDKKNLFNEIHAAMKTGSLMLIAEPAGHVSPADFGQMLSHVTGLGYEIVNKPIIKRSHSIVLRKK